MQSLTKELNGLLTLCYSDA